LRIATFDGDRIGVIEGDMIVDMTDKLSLPIGGWPPIGMLQVISQFARVSPLLRSPDSSCPRKRLSDVRLETPIAWPNKIIAFPANYRAHIDEMKSSGILVSNSAADKQGFFLKANSSLSGPNDPIVLPRLPGREIHHECELAVIVGVGGRGIQKNQAMNHVFGYACLVDLVVRGKEERVMRKSFDTFCPVGPYIVTGEEVTNPCDIDLELTVNGEVRQKANTRDLIVDIPAMIAMASAVMTLQPGDIIASGTPAGVGPVRGGDKLQIRIDGIGAMSLDVIQGEQGDHEVWH
jgi:2-keto-4-pentenoate hydratase/2-oxohepta-3-ene-1,7-dioic acid hydratase in catechol pathway